MIPSSTQFISVSEASRRANISRAALRKHLKVGRILSQDGKVDLASFNTWLASKQDVGIIPDQPQDIVDMFNASLPVFKTRQEAELYKISYEARLKQVEYDKELEEVVRIEDVVDAVSAQYSAIRTRLLALPAEMAPQIFNCKTVAETQGKMHKLITRALEELSKDEEWIHHLQERGNSPTQEATQSPET